MALHSMLPPGHPHHEGVLQYSTIELVVLFHTMDELHIAACGVVKASMLHEEAIRVRTSPPSATQVRAYMAVVNEEPSGTKPPPSNGEEEPHSSPSNPNPGRKTPQLQANLGDLMDDELWHLMEDLHWDVALWELNTLPDTPINTLGKSCGKWGSWCRWPGGHLSERERVGSARVAILTSFPCTTRWRVGTQKSTSLPPAPVQPNEDVGCLINTLSMVLQLVLLISTPSAAMLCQVKWRHHLSSGTTRYSV